MQISGFTPLPALLGGVLIGLAASLLLLTHGRVAGITGIFAGLFDREARGHRAAFVAALVAVGVVAAVVAPRAIGAAPTSLAGVAVAGLLVGLGTRLANGCTSGHGVCGLSRMSLRSLVATVTFMATGLLTVFVARHVL